MAILQSHPDFYDGNNTTVNIGAGARWETTITVPHANKGNFCIVAHSAHHANNLVMWGYIDTTSVGKFAAHNHTAGAINLTKGTPRIACWIDNV
jgi:hypothetical protein